MLDPGYRKTCAICGGADLTTILDLGMVPLPERHDDPRLYPLGLVECQDCTLVQSSYIADPREVFPADHVYATGNTQFMRRHFASLARQLGEPLDPSDLVVDIAANDGTLLHAYPKDVRRRIGVEPTNQARKISQDCDVYQDFFTAALAGKIVADHGAAKVVTACNVLAHVPELHDFAEGLRVLLADDGLLVAEAHDVMSVINGLQIDTVYAEHLYHYSVATLSRLLAMHGLTVTQAEPIPTQGGSFRVYARKQRPNLAWRAREMASDLYDLLESAIQSGGIIYGVGAATRATPLIHFARIAPYVSVVCEVASSEKIGLLMPGTEIPVVDEVRLIEDQPAYALLFSWHIADSLIPKLRAMGYRGRFIVPLPDPKVIDEQ